MKNTKDFGLGLKNILEKVETEKIIGFVVQQKTMLIVSKNPIKRN